MIGQQETIRGVTDAEYAAFVEKFEGAKTTDDCYTPPLVYAAVADWVSETYGVDRSNMVRPFHPGGDYQAEQYRPEDVVVDNPPFSILAQIVAFYGERGIPFFLFAPALTLFSSSSSSCAIGVGYSITYANGAKVATSFLTNLEREARARSAPDLYAAIKRADEQMQRLTKPELPQYAYPPHVLTAAMLNRYAKYGVEFAVSVAESERIGTLDAQRPIKKSIFGNGYLLSEKAAAEKAAAEKAAAVCFDLSRRERAIVARLSGLPFDEPDEEADPDQIKLF